MRLEQVGSRWLCRWRAEDMRRFVLEHVLLHEIGHHVYWKERARLGLVARLALAVREQFAEAYALRHLRNR